MHAVAEPPLELLEHRPDVGLGVRVRRAWLPERAMDERRAIKALLRP